MPELTAAGEILVPADQVFPILKQNILVDGFHLVVDLERSHGSYMVSALDGKEYLDCYSYFASLPVGHNHPGMRDPEFQRVLLRAAGRRESTGAATRSCTFARPSTGVPDTPCR